MADDGIDAARPNPTFYFKKILLFIVYFKTLF